MFFEGGITIEKIHYTRKEYREQYLRSEEWRLLSVAILLRDPVCRLCEKNKSTDAHHLTYERIHHERSDDLIGVCRKCHNFIHAHKELSGTSSLKNLKLLFDAAKKPCFIDDDVIKKFFASDWNTRRVLAGILKISASDLESLEGKRISFFMRQKLLTTEAPIYTEKRQKFRRYGKGRGAWAHY